MDRQQTLLPEIFGFNATSEAGSDLFSASIFLFGCNLRCPYCMNKDLVLIDKKLNSIRIEEIKQHIFDLNISNVHISGGEPTNTPKDKMTALIHEIRSWGCTVGMSTNGTRPEYLKSVLGVLTHVSLDIKSASKHDYNNICSEKGINAIDRVIESKKALMEEERTNFSYEIRTTAYPEYINKNNIKDIVDLFFIQKHENWAIQPFRRAKRMISEEAYREKEYSSSDIDEIVFEAKRWCDNVKVKYV